MLGLCWRVVEVTGEYIVIVPGVTIFLRLLENYVFKLVYVWFEI